MAKKPRQRELLARRRVSQSLVIDWAVTWGVGSADASRLYKAAKALEDAGFTISK